MPGADYIPQAQPRDVLGEISKALFTAKEAALREALQQKQMELLPLQIEHFKTQNALQMFELQNAKDLAPLQRQGLQADITNKQTEGGIRAGELAYQPQKQAQEQQLTAAQLARDTALTEGSQVATAGQRQSQAQAKEQFPLQQQATQAAIAASEASVKNITSEIQNRTAQQEAENKRIAAQQAGADDQLLAHTLATITQNPNGLPVAKAILANHPTLGPAIKALPDQIDPANPDDYLMRAVQTLGQSNDPVSQRAAAQIILAFKGIRPKDKSAAEIAMEQYGGVKAPKSEYDTLAEGVQAMFKQKAQPAGEARPGGQAQGPGLGPQPAPTKGEAKPTQKGGELGIFQRLEDHLQARTNDASKKFLDAVGWDNTLKSGNNAQKGAVRAVTEAPIDSSTGWEIQKTGYPQGEVGALFPSDKKKLYTGLPGLDEEDAHAVQEASVPTSDATPRQVATMNVLLSEIGRSKSREALLAAVDKPGALSPLQIENIRKLAGVLGLDLQKVVALKAQGE